MDSPNVAVNCTADIKAKLDSIPGKPFKDKVFPVKTQDDFKAKISQGMKPPFAGVMYSGTQGQASGLAGEALVIVIYGTTSVTKPGEDTDAWTLMKKGRDVILGQPSPSRHKWLFRQEKYFDNDGGVAYHTQAWATVHPLTG